MDCQLVPSLASVSGWEGVIPHWLNAVFRQSFYRLYHPPDVSSRDEVVHKTCLCMCVIHTNDMSTPSELCSLQKAMCYVLDICVFACLNHWWAVLTADDMSLLTDVSSNCHCQTWRWRIVSVSIIITQLNIVITHTCIAPLHDCFYCQYWHCHSAPITIALYLILTPVVD